MRAERIRMALAGAMVAIVIAIGPAQLGAATPDPTEPPAEEPAPEEPAPEEPAEPADDTPVDGEETAPEPGDVSPAVWVGVAVLVALAVVWAVRQATKSSSSEEP